MRYNPIPRGKIKAGQKVLSEKLLNGLIASSISTLESGPGTLVSRFGSRLSVRADPEPNPDIPVLRHAVVIWEFDDYLLCGPYNFTGKTPLSYDPNLGSDNVIDSNGNLVSDPIGVDPTLFYVAKPVLLQKTPWDGRTVDIYGDEGTYTYSSTGKRKLAINSDTFNQEITAPYFTGEPLTAEYGPTGYAKDDTQQIDIVDPDSGEIISITQHFDRFIVWTDINTGGRNWGGEGVAASSDLIVRASDGTSRVSGVSILEFDSPDLWTITNPSKGIARVTTNGYTGTFAVVTGCSGTTLHYATITIKRGIVTNVTFS